MRLEVRVDGTRVASLFRERGSFFLLYDRDVPPEKLVSLTMPVQPAPWEWQRDLHPFFRQNLPEGYLLDVLREDFGPLLDGTDFSLLALVGGSGIGRVTVVPEGKADGEPVTAFDLKAVLHGDNTEAAFEQLVREHARSAVSGVFPKFLEPPPATGLALPERITVRNGTHIIKGSRDSTPFLGLNEHYSLEVLRRTEALPVAESQLSDDGRALVVKRFDVDDEGRPCCAVEDVCGLLGLPPHEKYDATTEQVIRMVRTYVAPQWLQRELERLGWLLLSSYVLRNADQHTKNIALCYTHARDVRLAPAYDVVTIQAYGKYAQNPPGLSVNGRKSWVAGKELQKLFNARLNIPPRQFHAMVERLCEATTETGHRLLAEARQRPEWRDVVRNMLHAWNDGMENLRSAKPAPALRPLAPALAAAGLGERDSPVTSRSVIGRSELLGRS